MNGGAQPARILLPSFRTGQPVTSTLKEKIMDKLQRALCMALVATSAGAFAQQDAPPGTQRDTMNPRADTEANPSMVKMPPAFEKLDADGDGFISTAEFDRGRVQGMTLAQADSNGDGKVSRDEWNAHRTQHDEPQRK
jgi:hypothetical protein